ncbi:MAG: NUDIX hydrolase [Actinomycetota bacterium]
MTNDHGFEIVRTETASDLGFLRVDVATVRTPTGEDIERVVVVHPGAVAVVPLYGDDIVLIAQYRAPVDGVVVEIPAGKLDRRGEDRTAAAVRELAEETGYLAHDLVHLTDLKTGVGFTNEEISIYLAPSVTPGPAQPVGAEEAEAHVFTMPFAQAVEEVARGTITDAKTVAGILLVERIRGTA